MGRGARETRGERNKQEITDIKYYVWVSIEKVTTYTNAEENYDDVSLMPVRLGPYKSEQEAVD